MNSSSVDCYDWLFLDEIIRKLKKIKDISPNRQALISDVVEAAEKLKPHFLRWKELIEFIAEYHNSVDVLNDALYNLRDNWNKEQ